MKWTFPGLMWVPCKHYPKINDEYHSIYDFLFGIMYTVSLVENKDAPKEKKNKFHEQGETASLLLHLCKSIFTTFLAAKVVIQDSGFYFLLAIIAFKLYVVFSSAQIEK